MKSAEWVLQHFDLLSNWSLQHLETSTFLVSLDKQLLRKY